MSSETETVLDELATLVERGGFGGSAPTRGGAHAFVFDSTHQRAVWQPNGVRNIRAIRKCPGSSIDLVISRNDLTKTQLLAMAGGGVQTGIIYYDGDGATSSSMTGLNYTVNPNDNDIVYLNWATSSWGLVIIYYDYVI